MSDMTEKRIRDWVLQKMATDAPYTLTRDDLGDVNYLLDRVASVERERDRLETLLGEQMGELHLRDGKDIHSVTWLPGDKRAFSPRQRAILGLRASAPATPPANQMDEIKQRVRSVLTCPDCGAYPLSVVVERRPIPESLHARYPRETFCDVEVASCQQCAGKHERIQGIGH